MNNLLSPSSLDQDRFERSKRIKWFDLDKIKNTKLLVVGAGALGNEVIKNLILSGYQNITLVDMDHVVRSNLNRCIFFSDKDAEKKRMKSEVVAEKARELDPNINIKTHATTIQELGEDFIGNFDIVLGCLDNVAARIYLNSQSYHRKIPYIDGGTDALLGKVQVVFPPKTPCLECGMNRTHMKIMNERFSCTGREVSFYEPRLAAEITTTSIIAAVQVREALKISCGLKEHLIENLFYYDGVRNVADILEIDINPDCPNHV